MSPLIYADYNFNVSSLSPYLDKQSQGCILIIPPAFMLTGI